jgi:ABC-type bacteriocin/lantibiotic exporter with double-glycine peptidase domain
MQSNDNGIESDHKHVESPQHEGAEAVLVADAHAHAHSHHDSMPPLARIYSLLKPDMRDIAVVALFAGVIGILSLATPLAVEALVNTIAFGRLVQPIYVLCAVLLVFLGFAALLRAFQAWVVEVIQQRIFVRVVADLAWRLPRARYTEFDTVHGPELLNRFFDVMTVQKAAAALVLDGTAIVLQVVIGMIVLAFYHPYLLGFDVVLVASMTLIVWLLGRGAIQTAIEESKAKYSVGAWLEEIVRTPSEYKNRLTMGQAERKLDQLTSHYLDARKRHFRILIRQVCFALALQAIAGSVLFGIGGYLVLKGELSLGQLVAAELIVSLITGSFAKLGKHMESYYDLLAAVDKLGHLFDLPVERETGHALRPTSTPPALTMRGMDFIYSNSERGLAPINLHVRSGELVVVTGAPGAGKSTLIDLCYGLREPTKGFIEVNGINLHDISLLDYRDQTQLIRQPFIVEASLEENLTLRRESVTIEEIVQVTQDLGLREFVRKLPQGLHTPLTMKGLPLSEQPLVLINLARALLAKPKLILIDGTLDVLPADMLKQVMRTFAARTRETTVIITTNRAELISYADQHVVLSPPPDSLFLTTPDHLLNCIGAGA